MTTKFKVLLIFAVAGCSCLGEVCIVEDEADLEVALNSHCPDVRILAWPSALLSIPDAGGRSLEVSATIEEADIGNVAGASFAAGLRRVHADRISSLIASAAEDVRVVLDPGELPGASLSVDAVVTLAVDVIGDSVDWGAVVYASERTIGVEITEAAASSGQVTLRDDPSLAFLQAFGARLELVNLFDTELPAATTAYLAWLDDNDSPTRVQHCDGNGGADTCVFLRDPP